MDFTNHPQGGECITETKSDELDGIDIGNVIMHRRMRSIFYVLTKRKKGSNLLDIKFEFFVTITMFPK